MGAVPVCPAQTLPAACPRFSKHPGKGRKPHKPLLQNTGQGPLPSTRGQLKLPEEPPRKMDGSSAPCPQFSLPLQQCSGRQQRGWCASAWTATKSPEVRGGGNPPSTLHQHPNHPKKKPTSNANNSASVTFFFYLIEMVWRKHLAVAPV